MVLNDDGYDTDPPVLKELSGMNLEELIGMVRGAEQLGLGVQVSNYVEPSPDNGGSYTEVWHLKLLHDVPLRDDGDSDGQ
ncbi:hypothetical protein [Streptosporangium sp. NPDC020145]|uniref:hypothetical protein n=1 Tax=Streptosporangium sp. NPDC020145 TaxID=3154694 RepID=UPI00344A7FC0